MVWYSHLFQNFPRFIVIHIVKGFGIVNKAEIDVFLELSCFSMIQQMLTIWSLIPVPFLTPAWTSGSYSGLYLIHGAPWPSRKAPHVYACTNGEWGCPFLSTLRDTLIIVFTIDFHLCPRDSEEWHPPCIWLLTGWMASPTRWTWTCQTPGDTEGQGGLVCCRPWGHKELDTT